MLAVWKLNLFWKKIQLCLWDSNWVPFLVFSSKRFCRSSHGYHDCALFYKILVSVFSWETWRRLLFYCWSEVGNKSFFLFWKMVLFSTHNHCGIYMLFSLNNYSQLQSLLDFCVPAQQDSEWLSASLILGNFKMGPQQPVGKQIFVYFTFLLKSSADKFSLFIL